MKLDRRGILVIAGIASLTGTGVQASAALVEVSPQPVGSVGEPLAALSPQFPLSPLFAADRLPDATWMPIVANASGIEQYAAFEYANVKCFNIMQELRWSYRNEIVATAERGFLIDLCGGCHRITVDFSSAKSNADHYIDTVLANIPPNANTLIVSGGVLANLIAGEDRFMPVEKVAGNVPIYEVGLLDQRVRVFKSEYPHDTSLSMVGFVEPLHADRKISLVRTGGHDYELGHVPGYNHYKDWVVIQIDLANMIS